jgi:hypothetical protein
MDDLAAAKRAAPSKASTERARWRGQAMREFERSGS